MRLSSIRYEHDPNSFVQGLLFEPKRRAGRTKSRGGAGAGAGAAPPLRTEQLSLFEGTGLYNGRSRIAELSLAAAGAGSVGSGAQGHGQAQGGNSPAAVRAKALGRQYFGEGITVLHGKLYELTWQEDGA